MRYIQGIFRRPEGRTTGTGVATAALLIATGLGGVRAQDVSGGLRLGTMGLGAEATARIVDPIGVRLGFNRLGFSVEGEADDVDYNFDALLSSVPIKADIYLSRNGFRITGGLTFNGNRLDMESDFEGEVDIGDSTYTDTQTGMLTGRLDFADVAPFLGFGIDTSLGKRSGLGFLFELGVLFQGSPGVQLGATGPVKDDPPFLVELDKEEEFIEDELKFFKWYPVLALGITYKFYEGALTPSQ